MSIDKAKLKALAEGCRDEVIRSHGWAGMIEGADLLRRDEQYLKECSPEAVLVLLAEIERLIPFEEAYATACSVRNRLIEDNELQDRLIVANKALSDSFRAERDQLKAENQRLRSLASRTLWIAYVWNDHNFLPAHIEARKEAKKLGINSLKEANEFIAAMGKEVGHD